MSSQFPPDLRRRLEENIPGGHSLKFHYLRSCPKECDPIFAAAPGAAPEPTTWESQLLSVAIEHDGSMVQVFAIEGLIYTTDRLLTIFISKADSTGYLHLANLPKSARSAVQTITSAFLQYLVAWKRGSRRLLLSLFARAQAQYLFPGSVENRDKHVLDDRQLIRWWCRIVDHVLAGSESASPSSGEGESTVQSTTSHEAAPISKLRAWLIIPGVDAHEARTYTPRGSKRWVTTESPLKQLAVSPDVPERCLIPRFPDDPKARFALDLDGELPENAIQLDGAEAPEPSKTGKWRSVDSLDQFWELMAFRQECAAGRVVGFLWAVIEPNKTEPPTKPEASIRSEAADTLPTATSLPISDRPSESTKTKPGTPLPLKESEAPSTTNPESEAAGPVTALSVSASQYAAITLLLDKLDYADLAIAKISTSRFLTHAKEQAGVSSDAKGWGMEITGTREQPSSETVKAAVEAQGMPTLLVGRKRKKDKPVDVDQAKRAKAEPEEVA